MKRFSLFICAAIGFCTLTGIHAEDIRTRETEHAEMVKEFRMWEAQKQQVESQYEKKEKQLIKELYDAIKKFAANKSFLSPLHQKILAVDTWKIKKADDLLLSVFDYRIDQ